MAIEESTKSSELYDTYIGTSIAGVLCPNPAKSTMLCIWMYTVNFITAGNEWG